MPLIDYQELVDKLVRDDSGSIDVSDRDDAIALAVERYSQDRPNTAVEDVTADGTNYLDLPPSWEDEYSELRAIEYPIGNFPNSFLDQESYRLYQAPSGIQIAFRSPPAALADVRVSFTIRRVLDGSSDTIPAIHKEAVASWAASVLCEQLASIFSGDSDSTIQADNVDHNSKAREFAGRAKTLRKRYFDELGVDPKRNVAAGVVVNMTQNDSRGRDRLQHPGRYR